MGNRNLVQRTAAQDRGARIRAEKIAPYGANPLSGGVAGCLGKRSAPPASRAMRWVGVRGWGTGAGDTGKSNPLQHPKPNPHRLPALRRLGYSPPKEPWRRVLCSTSKPRARCAPPKPIQPQHPPWRRAVPMLSAVPRSTGRSESADALLSGCVAAGTFALRPPPYPLAQLLLPPPSHTLCSRPTAFRWHVAALGPGLYPPLPCPPQSSRRAAAQSPRRRQLRRHPAALATR